MAILTSTRTRVCAAAAAVLFAGVLTAGGRPGFLPGSTPTLSAALAATPNQSRDASAQLADQLAQTRLATAKYANNVGAAIADGYNMLITPMMPNMGIHYLNPSVQGFDATKPPILVYERHGKDNSALQLAALEWVFPAPMPATPPLPNATFGFFPAACHYANGTFIAGDFNAGASCPTKNDAGKAQPPLPGQGDSTFTFWHPPLFTMHVWVWYPNPDGLYGSTNPLITPFNNG